jgi:hypothetical protein
MDTRKALLRALVIAALGVAALMLPSIAAAKDRNHDRIPDRWEKRHGLSLQKNQAHRNQDRDALVNRQEFKAGDDPLDPDSDNDGVEDGADGTGTIASFDGTTLVINLFDPAGSTLSGQVTDQTEIECDNGDDQGDEDNDGEGGGDNSGPGGGDDKAAASSTTSDDDPGDDDGTDDENDDQGDDGQNCSAADLVAGAVVQEAELDDTGTVFDKVELMTGNNDLVGDDD